MPADQPSSRSGTVAVSWGKSGGWYIARGRICFGRLALTYVPRVDLDQMMRAYADQQDPMVDWEQVAQHRGAQIERMRWTLQEITEPDWWENALNPQRGPQLAKQRLEHELSVDRGEAAT